MESNNNYRKAHIPIQLPEEANKLLTLSCNRSNRKKYKKPLLRLEDHLKRFWSKSEINQAVSNQNYKKVKERKAKDANTSNA